jgi:hypothetical protein
MARQDWGVVLPPTADEAAVLGACENLPLAVFLLATLLRAGHVDWNTIVSSLWPDPCPCPHVWSK